MCLGIPGRIVKVDDAARKLATVEVSGVKRQINIACIVNDTHPVDACVGDRVLIPVGFAMSRFDEAQAGEQSLERPARPPSQSDGGGPCGAWWRGQSQALNLPVERPRSRPRTPLADLPPR